MSAFTVTVDDGIARAEFNLQDEPVNKITHDVGEELDKLLTDFAVNDDIQAVILVSGKDGSFIAGADIDEFVALRSRDEAYQLVRRGQRLINRFEDLGKPVVAAIHGTCLGGGLEAALACTYRIATDAPSTKIGLPEVQLGIIPAAGGCQRLPRLIGVRAALDIILAGKQRESRRGVRRFVSQIIQRAVFMVVGNKAAVMHAACNLFIKCDRNHREFFAQPLVSLVVNIVVAPQRRKSGSIVETHLVADRIVAFAMS